MTPEQNILIERIRTLFVDEPEVREVSMFGGRSVMVNETMIVSALKDGGLLVRVVSVQLFPLGVPEAPAPRRGEPVLTPSEIAHHVRGDALVVRIGSKNLSNPSRAIMDLGNPSWEAAAD